MSLPRRYLSRSRIFCAVVCWLGLALGSPSIFALRAMAQPENPQTIDPAWLDKAKAGLQETLKKYDDLASRLEEIAEYRYDKAPGPAGKIPFEPFTRMD